MDYCADLVLYSLYFHVRQIPRQLGSKYKETNPAQLLIGLRRLLVEHNNKLKVIYVESRGQSQRCNELDVKC